VKTLVDVDDSKYCHIN